MISITRKGLKVQFKESGKLCYKNSTKLVRYAIMFHFKKTPNNLEYIFNVFEHYTGGITPKLGLSKL